MRTHSFLHDKSKSKIKGKSGSVVISLCMASVGLEVLWRYVHREVGTRVKVNDFTAPL